MNIKWNISESDIKKVTDFVNHNKGPLVEKRIKLNIYRQNILVDKDSILKSMLMSILTTQQRSDSDSSVNMFLRQDPFPLTYSILSHEEHVEHYVRWILQKNNLNKYINKVPVFYSVNFSYLEDSKWLILSKIEALLDDQATKKAERDVADYIDQSFKGFGSMQARNFLQNLGLTKFEIPIDFDNSKLVKRIRISGYIYHRLPCKTKIITILYLMGSKSFVKRPIFILVFLMQQYFQAFAMDERLKTI